MDDEATLSVMAIEENDKLTPLEVIEIAIHGGMKSLQTRKERRDMDEIQNELLAELNEPEFRHAYASEFIDMILARQIRALRKQRNWTQQQLAERIQKHQSFISALEDEEYGSMTLSTLKELAESFDVYLSVRFKSFRNLIEQVSHSSMKDLEVPSFEEDPVFQSPVRDERIIAGTKPGRTKRLAPQVTS